MSITYRPITKEDNAFLGQLIRQILREMACTESEYLCHHQGELDDIYSQFQGSRRQYWVVVDEEKGILVGGGGYAPLAGSEGEARVAEIQKMYLLSSYRGKGMGQALLEMAICAAREDGYQSLYLETMPQMKGAQELYKKYGFQFVPERQGNTGHSSCQVFMSREL